MILKLKFAGNNRISLDSPHVNILFLKNYPCFFTKVNWHNKP